MFGQNAAPRELLRPAALVVGAIGRLGEAVLTQVLAHGNYARVYVLGQGNLSSTVRGLAVATLNQLPDIDDVYLIVSDADDPRARSYHGRDLRFEELTTANLVPVAKAAAHRGARRLVLLSPAPAWQQMSRFQQGLMNETESAIASLSYESVVIMRPVAQSKSAAGSVLQRAANFYLDLQLMMMPRSIPVLTSDQLGRAAVAAQRKAREGVTVYQAAEIEQLLNAVPIHGADRP